MNMNFDLLLKGGTLIDPAQGIDAPMDVAFRDGKVARVAADLPVGAARKTIECAGRLIVPGMIDLHVHVDSRATRLGVEADRHCIAAGVTTAVDAGSTGAGTFADFRQGVVRDSKTRLFALLHISSPGLSGDGPGELIDMAAADVARTVETIEANRDVIVGVKVRLTRKFVNRRLGMGALELAGEAAAAVGLPLCVHPQDAWCETIDDIVDRLRAGDILTHCFHAMRCGILDDRGGLRRAVRRAIDRGVVFDVAHGRGSFCWEVAERALEQGFRPNSISTDLHAFNAAGPVFDLSTTIDKFITLGLSLNECIAKVTAGPAAVLGKSAWLGTLREGAAGDAVLLRVERGHYKLADSNGVVRIGRRRIKPECVIKNGLKTAA